MSEVRLPELAEQIGVPDIGGMSQLDVADNLMPASVAAFSDGDLAVAHEPFNDKEKSRLFGYRLYNDGLVARQMLKTALENGMKPGPVYDFGGFAAEYFDYSGSPFQNHMERSAIRVYPEAVTIDDNPLALRRVPRVVIDYAGCLTSRSLISDQLDFINNGRQPFTYTPLTRLHFTNRVLMQTYDKELGRGGSKAAIQNQLYIGREDGIASATSEMISAQTQAGAPVEIADIIVCTGSQHTTAEDLRQGAVSALTLIKEAGMFIIRSYARPSAAEIGTDQIADWAYEAGFEEQVTFEYRAVSHNIGSMLLTGKSATREMKTIVLTK